MSPGFLSLEHCLSGLAFNATLFGHRRNRAPSVGVEREGAAFHVFMMNSLLGRNGLGVVWN